MLILNSPTLYKEFEDLVQDMDFRSGENLSSMISSIMQLKENDKIDERKLAEMLLDKGREMKLVDRLDDEAYTIFQSVLMIEPNNADAHYHQAWIDYFKENITAAISHFEIALTQDSLNPTLRIRALCKLTLLYASVEDLSKAGSKVKEVVSFISSAKLEQRRELATLVDMTVFMFEQAQTIAGKIVELAKPLPYLGLDVDGEHVLSYEAKETWLNSVKNNDHVLLDLTEKKPHIYVGKGFQVLSENESMIIQELMCSGQPLTVQRIVDVVLDGSLKAPSVKKSISRIRHKLGDQFKKSDAIICTIPNGYLWSKKRPWKIVKINYIGDVE